MLKVNIARCEEHGLHGERDECFVCGGGVEQVPMVPLNDLMARVADLQGDAKREFDDEGSLADSGKFSALGGLLRELANLEHQV